VKKLILLLILSLGLAGGCGSPGPKTTRTDPKGHTLKLVAPESTVKATQGLATKFPITVQREDFDADVKRNSRAFPRE
jgi:hypothetical protein